MVKDLRPALRAYLLADAAIAAQVGARVFPSFLPQGIVAPSIVYHRISGFGDHTMQGPSGYTVSRVQVTAFAQALDTAEAIANLVKARLDGYRGTMGAGLAAVKVQGVFYETDNPPTFDDARKIYGAGRDYMVHFGEL